MVSRQQKGKLGWALTATRGLGSSQLYTSIVGVHSLGLKRPDKRTTVLTLPLVRPSFEGSFDPPGGFTFFRALEGLASWGDPPF